MLFVIKLFFLCLYSLLTILLAIPFTTSSINDEDEKNCRHCRYLVKTFNSGLENTKKLHFGGGNTDWEERKLGTYKTSEARFVEIMDMICGRNVFSDDLFDDSKKLQFKCHAMAEKYEEFLETWFFRLQNQNPDLEKYLCVETLKFCCPNGYFGNDCSPCPGILKSGAACFGRGSCLGSGLRNGNGSCNCSSGYVGVMCSNCASNYFMVSGNETYVECKECFDGCASGCTTEGPKGCQACRSGYTMTTDGCVDVDECQQQEGGMCTKDNEKCVNTMGSFECECIVGYKRNADTFECEEEGKSSSAWISPNKLLRFSAYSGLFIILVAFIMHRSSIALFFSIFVLFISLFVANYYDSFNLLVDLFDAKI